MTIDPFQTLVIGTILLFVSSLTFYYWELKALGLILPLAALSIYKLSGDYNTFTLILSPLVFGSFTGITVKRSLSVQFYIIASTLTLSAIISALYYYLLYVTGVDILEMIHQQMATLLQSSRLQESEQAEFMSNINLVMAIIRDVMPFYFFLNSLIWSTLTFLFLRLFYTFLIVKGPVILRGLEFYKLNDYTVFLLIGLLAAFIFVTPDLSVLANNAALNGLLILAVLYLIQALGIIRHFLIRKNLPLYILPLGIFITLMFSWPLLPIVSIVLAGWGVLDLWTDFRNLNHKNDST